MTNTSQLEWQTGVKEVYMVQVVKPPAGDNFENHFEDISSHSSLWPIATTFESTQKRCYNLLWPKPQSVLTQHSRV